VTLQLLAVATTTTIPQSDVTKAANVAESIPKGVNITIIPKAVDVSTTESPDVAESIPKGVNITIMPKADDVSTTESPAAEISGANNAHGDHVSGVPAVGVGSPPAGPPAEQIRKASVSVQDPAEQTKKALVVVRDPAERIRQTLVSVHELRTMRSDLEKQAQDIQRKIAVVDVDLEKKLIELERVSRSVFLN
jgi:hypothetical protein